MPALGFITVIYKFRVQKQVSLHAYKKDREYKKSYGKLGYMKKGLLNLMPVKKPGLDKSIISNFKDHFSLKERSVMTSF